MATSDELTPALTESTFRKLAMATWAERVKTGDGAEMPDLPAIDDLATAMNAGDLDDALPEFIDRVAMVMEAFPRRAHDLPGSFLNFVRNSMALSLSGELRRNFNFEDSHQMWLEAREFDDKIKHPLAPLIEAWFRRKPNAPPRTYSAGFFPSRLAGHERKRQAFGLPARLEHREGEQVVLPGFGSKRRMPALPEEFLRLGQLTRGGGRGAKLPLRATLAGVEFAPPLSRNNFYTMPVREFLNRIYPNGYPRGGRWRSELARVAEAQAAARVPYIDSDTGESGSTIPVLIWRIPNTIDGRLRIAVDLPPKSDKGAPITDNLYAYGAKDSRAFYAMLQLSVDWWQPGRTRVPIRKKLGLWAQLTDTQKDAHIERYEPYNREQIIELTAPLTTQRNERLGYQRGILTLKTLNDAGEIVLLPDGKDVWRILPPSAP